MPNSSTVSPLQALSSGLADLVAATAPSVVAVRSNGAQSSGLVWQPGLIVTADEALADEGEVTVTANGGEPVAATVVGRDPTTDIALLRVDGASLPALALNGAAVGPGALALAVGARDGGATAAFGVVAYAGPAWRSMRGGEIAARIELDLRMRGSSEGGAAVDAEGHVFGMTVFGPRRRVLVIPSATIARVAPQLESHGRIPRGYLGLGLQPVQGDGDDGIGVMVMSVAADGPGAAAGIRQGDVIVSWNGEPIRSFRALLRSLGSDSIGSKVTLSLRRGGEPSDVSLTIGERPAA